jgi:hypothetical protein
VLAAQANMHAAPNAQAPILGVVRKGNLVPTQGQSADARWWRILNPFNTGQQAWLVGTSVRANPRALALSRSGARVTALKPARLWQLPNPGSKVLATARAGVGYAVVGRTADNQWFRVRYGRTFAWMNASDVFVTAADQRTPVVKVVQ